MPSEHRQGRPTIGVLAGWQFAWTATPLSYLDPVYRGVSMAARDLDCNVLLGCGMGLWNSRTESLRPAWPLSSPESDFVPIGPWNVDGLIAVNPLHSDVLSRYLQDLRAAAYPVIFVASGEAGPTITADNYGGIRQAIRHLVEHGHRRIAFVAGSPEDMDGDTGERLRAYYDAVESHGLATDPRLVAWGSHVYGGGHSAMQEILASGTPFTAVLASNDESALGAIWAIREAGCRIPEDVAIVGFDDRPESAVQNPPLSSVHVPLQQMGYRAVASLYRYITGQAETIAPAVVETHLVARESCGCDQSVIRSAPSMVVALPTGVDAPAAGAAQLAQTMAESVLTEARGLSVAETVTLCRRLVAAFDASVTQADPSHFHTVLDAVLHQVAKGGDDVHVWQAALSSLEAAYADRPTRCRGPAQALLARARVTISAHVRRQLRQYTVDQHWTLNRLGTLTAHLLAALDEAQIYQVLKQHLPTMGVETAWLALFDPEDDDPVAWTTLRDITAVDQPVLRFPSREFPPRDLLPADQAFGLALFPLTGPRGQIGYAAFDVSRLTLCGAITQELATALHAAHLHREATEARRLAEEANELKSRFLSTVSHELRTPLNLIVGLSGILLQESDESGSPLPALHREDVEQIHANAQHLGGLLGDVLDLAKGDAGQLSLANDWVDLSAALRLVTETGRLLARDKGLSWQSDLPESGPWVWGDRTRLRQVILNLVNNAVKFTAHGQVRLALTSGPGSVTVAVHDTGLGIPPEEQSVIFDEFRRTERSIERGFRGLGLGLAISKRIIELHGGTIGVRSTGEDGAGSTLYFTLPTVQPPADQVHVSATLSPTQGRISVLACRTGSGTQLHNALAERGFDVETVFTDETPDWLSRLEAAHPGAVVVDVGENSDQGWDVLRALKSHSLTRPLPVLLCSLAQDGGSVLEFDYLTKPVEVTNLLQALDQYRLMPDTADHAKVILVVDDDPRTLEMNARIVNTHSPVLQTLVARTGLEALEILRREPVDLVLLDLVMPELDGFGVLEAMRETEAMRRIPVIVLTGQVLTESDMARLNRGVQTVLSKGLFDIEEILAHVDAALERNRHLSDEAQRLVRQAMAYIHTHYAEPISRTDLARHVALSEDYLTSCFRTELGVTPIAYLNRYRVNQAKHLLADPDKSITEIALDVGFSDSGYFSRVFRREVGVSPDAYRQG